MARVLDRHFGRKGYEVSTRELSGGMVRIAALFDKTLKLIVNEVDKRQDVSHQRARRVLRSKPRGLEKWSSP